MHFTLRHAEMRRQTYSQAGLEAFFYYYFYLHFYTEMGRTWYNKWQNIDRRSEGILKNIKIDRRFYSSMVGNQKHT